MSVQWIASPPQHALKTEKLPQKEKESALASFYAVLSLQIIPAISNHKILQWSRNIALRECGGSPGRNLTHIAEGRRRAVAVAFPWVSVSSLTKQTICLKPGDSSFDEGKTLR